MKAFLAAFNVFVLFSTAVGLSEFHTDRRLMRKEQLELDAAGAGVHSFKAQPKVRDTDMCNDDFPIGLKDDNNCTHAHAEYENILQEAMCIQAARFANVTANHAKFRLTHEWFDKRPKGCFKAECDEDPKGICYFYNPVGDTPKHPVGEPVCSRPFYKHGTADGTTGVKCDEGYEPVMDEAACQTAGVCLGDCDGDEFRKAIQNASMYDEFPLGCFLQKDSEGCAFFNPARPEKQGTVPKNPNHHGSIPICKVSKTTFFKWEDRVVKAPQAEAAAASTKTDDGDKTSGGADGGAGAAAKKAAGDGGAI